MAINIYPVDIVGTEVNLGDYPYEEGIAGSYEYGGFTGTVYGTRQLALPSFSNYVNVRQVVRSDTAISWSLFGYVRSSFDGGVWYPQELLYLYTFIFTGNGNSYPANTAFGDRPTSEYCYRPVKAGPFENVSGGWYPDVTIFGSPKLTKNVGTRDLNHPCYRDLVGGYALDTRSIPNNPHIIPTVTKRVTIKYYKENKLEKIPNLKSIVWMVYECDLVKGNKYFLPIEDCVLGTLYCSDPDVLSLLSSLQTEAGKYAWSDLLRASIPSLFTHWQSIYDATNSNPTNAYIFGQTKTLRKIAANNDIWGNATLGNDINPDSDHPMFKIDIDRAYQWHLVPVENGVGDLVMEGPHTMEIHAALNAGVYSKNPNTGESRVANLGHLVEKIAYLFGYRPEPDGTLDHEKEKALVRTVISKDKPVDPAKVGVTSFGEQGMVVRRLNNSFSGKDITANQCVLVRDLPQILAEYQDQQNLALGLQESSAISIQGNNGTAKYNNQLAVLVELLNLATNNHDMIRSALVSSLVAQGQTTELIAALGLPSVTKTIPVEIDGKMNDLPYKGVAAHRSISQEIAVCTQNVGIVAGQLV
jgi:hypothetical protein